MLAIAKTRPEPGIATIEVGEQVLRPGHVRIAVEAASVCGTDLHIWNWDSWAEDRIHPPRIIGHEFCGTILAVADDVSERK
ncbi:MAG: L-threonine 3-dehydrogenase, partial [Armatimonadota bacterium]